MTPNIFATRSEIKRAVFMAKKEFPACRIGQAFLNKYPEFEAADQQYALKMWQDDNFERVVQSIVIIQQMSGAVERLDVPPINI